MSESATTGPARRRFFRSSWFSVLLATIAVALVLLAILSPSKRSPNANHRTAAASAASPASPPPCGGNPLGVSGQWTCTFDDEFNGTSLNLANWQPQLTATSGYVTGGPDCYVNSPDTISVSGGHLNLSAVKVAPFHCTAGYESSYEVGMVSSSTLFNQTYGVFEVRAKVPAATLPGLQETFWLYPQSDVYGPWPASGEIDFAEFFSSAGSDDVPSLHYTNSSLDPNATSFGCTINQHAFNTYEVDWTSTSITILANGQPCMTDQPVGGPAPFNQAFFISLTQALGVGDNSPTGITPLPATTEVDWVRVWAPAP